MSILTPALFALAASPGGDPADLPLTWCNPQPQGRTIRGLDFLNDSLGVAVGSLGTVLVTSNGGATWSDLSDYSALSQDLHEAVMLDSGAVLAVGESPGVFRSDDGGQTWSAVPNPSTGTLYDVERAGTDVVAAVGEGGQVLRSTDGGWTWTAVASPGPIPGPSTQPSQALAQEWLDGSTGFVAGTNIGHRTDDGGQTWTPLAGVPTLFGEVQGAFTEISFLDDGLHGYLGQQLGLRYQTTDGGLTWNPEPSTMFPNYIARLLPLGPSERVACADGEGARVWRTTDDGSSWTELLQMPETVGFPALERLPGGRLVVASTFGDLHYSDDIGASWTNAAGNADQGVAVEVSAIAFTPLGHGFAGSSSSNSTLDLPWFESVDNGATWAPLPAPPDVGDVLAIEFRGEDWGLAGGNAFNRIACTVDGGATWSHQDLNVPPGTFLYIDAFAMPADQTAYVAASGTGGCAVFKTTDRGQSWQPATAGIPASGSLRDISFLDEQLGYAVSGGGFFLGNGHLYRTTDGGGSWTDVSGPLPSDPYDLVFLDEDSGLFVDRQTGGGIWRTSDGGASWQQVHDQPSRDVQFLDSLRGMSVPTPSSNQSVVEAAITLDGGLTWQPAPVPLGGGAESLRAALGGFFLGGPGSKIVRVDPPQTWLEFGAGLAGTHGVPHLSGEGTLAPWTPVSYHVASALEGAPTALVLGLSQLDLPILGGVLVPALDVVIGGLAPDGAGSLSWGATWPGSFLPGTPTWAQAWVLDPAAGQGFASTNALLGTTP